MNYKIIAIYQPQVRSKSTIQQFESLLKKGIISILGTEGFEKFIRGNSALRFMRQLVLFRNPMAWNRKSFSVLKGKDVITIYPDSPDERRTYVSLHRKFLNSDGPHINIVFMGAGYSQPIHRHTLWPEHNLLVDSTALHLFNNGIEEIVYGGFGDITYVPAQMQHTLSNPTSRTIRNFTVKPDLDKRIFLDKDPESHNKKIDGDATILVGKPASFDWGLQVLHNIRSVNGVSYTIQFMKLFPGKILTLPPVSNKKEGLDEIVVLLGDGTVVANDTRTSFLMGDEDILYVNHHNPYQITNKGTSTTLLYRLVITQ